MRRGMPQSALTVCVCARVFEWAGMQSGLMDLSYIDPQFLNETIPQSLVGESNFQVDVEIDDTFSGFSYTANDAFEAEDKE